MVPGVVFMGVVPEDVVPGVVSMGVVSSVWGIDRKRGRSGMAIVPKRSSGLEKRSSGHPAVKAVVIVGGAVLVAVFAMELVSFLVGLVWKVVEIGLAVLVVGGIFHWVHKHRQHTRHALH